MLKLFLGLLLPFIFSVAHLENPLFQKRRTLKVMTYNIHHCNPPSTSNKIAIEAIAKVIKSQNPDLVALQEVDVNTIRSGKGNNQAEQLAKLCGMYYFFAKAIDYEGGEYGVAVLSRFPIIDSMVVPLPILPDYKEELRTVAVVTISLGKNKNLVFGSTHLGLKEPNRLIQTEKIIEKLGVLEKPVIIAGDFNAVPESSVISKLDKIFTRSCIQNCKFTVPEINPNKTIDYIMYNSNFKGKVSYTQVIDEQFASDHLPVVSELVLNL